jgi:hypothetical protein
MESFSQFFEYGEVAYLASDQANRHGMVSITMPCCLFQTISPILLGAGHIDNLELADPLAVWMPSLTNDRFISSVSNIKTVADQVNSGVRSEISRIVGTFLSLSKYLVEPSDIIPMLPLGTYIKFHFRIKIDRIIQMNVELDKINVIGAKEFLFALSEVTAYILYTFGDVVSITEGERST